MLNYSGWVGKYFGGGKNEPEGLSDSGASEAKCKDASYNNEQEGQYPCFHDI